VLDPDGAQCCGCTHTGAECLAEGFLCGKAFRDECRGRDGRAEGVPFDVGEDASREVVRAPRDRV
jgi:hypothetical protein